MLIGTSYHTLDSQRRVTVPKTMRHSLGDQPVLTRGLDGGIFLYPQENWDRLMNTLEHQPFTQRRSRDFLRLMSNSASVVQPDKLGRITIPEILTESFGLNKHIVVVGSLQYIEIWDRDRYHTYLDSVSDAAEDIAENLSWEDYARSSNER